MRWIFLSGLLITAAGCDTADRRFDRSFEIATTGRERCQVSLEAQDHFLRTGDEEKLDKWRSKGAFDCLSSGMTE